MKRLLFALLLLAAVVRADTAGSVYQLEAALADQSGNLRHIDLYQGHPVLVTMFYGSCPMACPLLIDTLRATERAVPVGQRSRLRFLLISIDPKRDTVANLRALAERRKFDANRWTLARTDAASVRKIAAVLGIQYRELPDGSYNHSSIVTLLDVDGEIRYQSSVLGKADPELLAALERMTQPTRAPR